MYVQHRPEIFPSPRWEKCRRACLDSRLHNYARRFGQLQWVCATETLQISHRHHVRLTFCSLLAGRRCFCLGGHSVNRELPDLLQHSSLCARSSSKHPIAPMGDSRFARCLQGGGVYVDKGSVAISSSTISGNTAGYVRAHPQKFLMPRWENG